MSCGDELGVDRFLDLGGRVHALLLAGHLGGGVEGGAETTLDLGQHTLVDRPRGEVPLGLADELLELELDGDELLDLLVGQLEGLDDDALGDLLGAGLDHDDGVGGAGDDEVHVGLVLELLEGRVHDQLPVDATDVDGAHGAAERDVADGERRGGAERREDVVGRLEVDGQRRGDDVDLVHEALGEQRPDGTVDLAGAKDRLLARTRLALDEAAGDLAGGVVPLFHVDRQGEEVLPFAHVFAHDCADEDDRVATTHQHGTIGLLCEATGLEGDGLTPDFYFNRVHFFLHLSTRRPIALGYSLVGVVGTGTNTATRLASVGDCLLAELELLDERAIALEVARLQVVEQATTLTDHLEQAAPAVVVLLVGLEVLGERRDALGEERDLHLGGASVAFVLGVLGDDGLFGVFGHCHSVSPPSWEYPETQSRVGCP